MINIIKIKPENIVKLCYFAFIASWFILAGLGII